MLVGVGRLSLGRAGGLSDGLVSLGLLMACSVPWLLLAFDLKSSSKPVPAQAVI